MAKKIPQEQRQPDDNDLLQKRVYQKDFRKVKPKRIVPGIIGRSEWFSERAGCGESSLSVGRLKKALQLSESMLTQEQRDQMVEEQAREALNRSDYRDRDRLKDAFALDANGKVVAVKERQRRKGEGISAVGRPVEIADLGKRAVFLFLPVDPRLLEDLDMEQIVVADISDRADPRLLETFKYWENEGVIVGQVDRPGKYQAFAWPRNPWVDSLFHTLCRYWKWVVYDPRIRKSVGGSNRPIIDRICQLILCAPDYYQLGDPRIFEEMGVGLPPGDWPGGNICEHCLGDFLGELEIIDDIYIKPPLIKWCCRKSEKCSRWVSIGPVPAENFGGIGRVSQLDIHPTNGNILVAAAAGGGVWRTNNGGASWYPLMELQPTLTKGAVAFAPSNPSIIYAGSGEDGGGWNPAWGGLGIYRTSDGGNHWTLMTSIPSTRFSAIIVHPTQANTLYVAGNNGLNKSIDGGLTWITNPGLTSLFDGQITDVVLAHDDPDRVYIGVASDGVYRSTTGGIQVGANPAFVKLDGMNQLPANAAAGWIKLSIGRSSTNGSNFLAAKLGPNGTRIFVTTNGGTTWTERAQNVTSVSFDEWCSVIAVDPENEEIIYAGAAGQLMRTTNGGAALADWTAINTGIHADQQDISFDPSDSNVIYLANDGGVYRSEDRGDTWTFAAGKLAITQFYDIDISERNKNVVAGGAQDNGVYYRNSAGVWTHIPWGDGTQTAIDPTDPNIFYFSSQNGLPSFLRRSIDGGASHQPLGGTGLSGGSPWVTIIKLDPTDPITDPANNRIVFVCGTNQLFRSTDGGQNWNRVEDGSGNPFQTVGTITALEFAPSNPRILYLGTSSGALYRGINGGDSAGDWTRIDTVGSSADALFPNVQIQSLRVHPMNANHVWVTFGGNGVSYTGRPDMILNPLGISHIFRTTNGGADWIDASGQLAGMSLPDIPTSAVALHDCDLYIAYAGTDIGIFRTTDGGVTWTAYQDGLPRSPVVELRFNRRFNRLFAGTMGRGVYVRDI